MKKHFHYLLVFLMPFLLFGQTWEQWGQDIYGSIAQLQIGSDVSMSSDGSIVAVATFQGYDPDNHTNGSTGAVFVYRYNGTAWEQMGQTLAGSAANDKFGNAISLSADGMRMAIGAPQNNIENHYGYVRIYHFDGTSWVQEAELSGEAASTTLKGLFGIAVSLSSDGTTVAVGADGDSTNGTNKGAVLVYRYNGSEWNQLGQKIEGENNSNLFGKSVAINSDGRRMAVIPNQYTGSATNSGKAYVYYYNAEENMWELLGNQDALQGQSANEYFARSSASINADGTIVAFGSNYINSNQGRAYAFKYNGTSWEQLGQNIDGEAAGVYTGNIVRLNGAGDIMAVTSPRAANGDIPSAGVVDIYKYNGTSWEQMGDRIFGRMANDGSPAVSVAVSSDGDRIAFGAPSADSPDLISNLGLVRMFEYVLHPLSVTVNTENNVEPEVFMAETLQLEALVLPEGANQEVTWSIAAGSGFASVDENGLVTGISSGTATARATSVGNPTIYGEIEIMVINPVGSIFVNVENGLEPEVFVAETLQLEAVVLPQDANQEVTWSIAAGSGFASVDENGLVTGISSGTATVRATSVENPEIYGEIEITVIAPVANISINVENGLEPEVFVGETLQLEAVVLPQDANQEVTWSIAAGSGFASVDENGLVMGISSGTATVRATSVENPEIYGEIEITVIAPVASISVNVENGLEPEVFVAETLQLEAVVLPGDANQEITWSIADGSSFASVDENGLVTGISPGVTTVRATSVENPLIYGEIEITVINPVASISINVENGLEPEVPVGETLQLEVVVLPEDANQEVTWNIADGSEFASVDENGLVTGLSEGIAVVRAVSVEDPSIYDVIGITVTEPMSVSESDVREFTYYPNPVRDLLYINSLTDIRSVRVYDMAGKLVFSQDDVKAGLSEFNVSRLNTGIYLVKIHTDKGVQTFKIIKK